jgi:hypothetical protein
MKSAFHAGRGTALDFHRPDGAAGQGKKSE